MWMDNEMLVRVRRASKRPSSSPARLAQWNVLNLILKRSMVSLLIFFFFHLLPQWTRACFSRNHIIVAKLSPHPYLSQPSSYSLLKKIGGLARGWVRRVLPGRGRFTDPPSGVHWVSWAWMSIRMYMWLGVDSGASWCGLLDFLLEAIILGFGVCCHAVLL